MKFFRALAKFFGEFFEMARKEYEFTKNFQELKRQGRHEDAKKLRIDHYVSLGSK